MANRNNHLRRQLVALLLIANIAYWGSGFACSKASTLSWSREVVSALREAGPLLQSLGVPLDKLNVAISAGDSLVAALENPSSNTDTKALASNLIHAFEEVVAQTDVIGDANRKTLILAILGIADIALHHIVDSIPPTNAVAASPAVLKFKASKVWQCRDAKTGKYQKMSFCKDHPDISVVETR
jgi:hypothetical protein